MVELKHLKKTYLAKTDHAIQVINDTTLSLPDVGIVSLLGASGSGKTTLLNTIGGLDRLDSGTICYDDVTFDKYKMSKIDSYRAKNIGYIFQNYNLLMEKTILENMEIALEIIGITDPEEVKRRIEYTLKSVGLYKFRRKLAKALSGGQMQRVSIARALLKNAKLIIADEPTGNLDSQNTIEVMNILKKISKKTLVLLVTHERSLAEYYSDMIVELKDGKVLDVRKANNTAYLDRKHQNQVYLLDLKHQQNAEGLITYDLYSDSEVTPLNLLVYVQNGTYYIKSPQKIQFIDDSDMVLLNEHYVEKKADEIEFEYDTSWYDEQKKSGKSKWFQNEFKTSFFSFFHSSGKNKFFNWVFFLIGIIIGIMNVVYTSYQRTNESSIRCDSQAIAISVFDNAHWDLYNEEVEKGLLDGSIDEALRECSFHADITYNASFNYKEEYYVHSQIYPLSRIKEESLIAGRMPMPTLENETAANEYVLGNLLADEIISKFTSPISYDQLIGASINGATICGIVKNDSSCLYSSFYQEIMKRNYGTEEIENYYNSVEIFSSNPKELIKAFRKKGMKVDFQKNLLQDEYREENKEQRMIIFGIIIVLFLMSCIYIYFSMRALMISDIYDIGVYRCLGFKRSHIYLKYELDIFIRVTFTCLLGYCCFSGLYGLLAHKLISLGITAISNIFSSASTYICMLLLYGLNALFGILPILFLLRKTPAEIISKYDI